MDSQSNQDDTISQAKLIDISSEDRVDISEESLYMDTLNMMQNVINQKIGNSDYITKKTYNNFMSSMILFRPKLVKSPSDNKKD